PRGLHQHPGNPEAGARRPADLGVGGDAAREARRVPPGDAQGGGVGAALRRARHQGPRLRPAERRRDRALRVVSARPAAAAEAARVAMTRFIARGGKIWTRVFPDKPITKKPQETRMGKGKGAPDQWVCVVRPGRVLFEMEGVTEKDAREAMRLAAAKLPIMTKFATRFAQEKML